jgi:hypothetical protein
MRKVSTLMFFIFCFGLTTAQSNSGFLKGDKELIRFLGRKLINQPFNDTSSYLFTIAVLIFDDNGAIDTVKFMNDNDVQLQSYISNELLESKQMWDTSRTKNFILLIPFEIINLDAYGNIKPVQDSRMLSQEFMSLFKKKYTLNTTLLEPIIVIHYPPNRREGR